MPDNNLIITDANYRENLERMTGVVLFYKELCPNCKAIEKMLENSSLPIPGYLTCESTVNIARGDESAGRRASANHFGFEKR